MAASRTAQDEGAARTRRSWSVAVGPGMVVGLIATVALVVSMFMTWQAGGIHPSDVPAAFLWDRDATGSPSFLVYLIPLAAILGIGSLLRGGSGLRILAGLLTMVVVGVYAYQVHEITESLGVDFGDSLESGSYVAAAAGIVGFVSGFLPTRVRSRRVERVDA